MKVDDLWSNTPNEMVEAKQDHFSRSSSKSCNYHVAASRCSPPFQI